MLRKLSLRHRLILAFFILVSVMSTSSYLAISFSTGSAAELRSMVEDQNRRVILAQRTAQHIQTATNRLLLLLQTELRENRIPLYRQMDQALATADAAIRTLKKEIDSEELAGFVELRELYGVRFQETVEDIEFHGLETAREHFKEHTYPLLQQLLAQAERISIIQQDAMLESEARYAQQNERLTHFILTLELLLVMLALIFSARFARNLSELLNGPIKIADQIASGDYTTAIPHSENPELKRLLNALQRMRTGILNREAQISRLAFEDSITLLGNRTRFMQSLDDALAQNPTAIVLFDINRFEQINRSIGHSLGDQVLQEVGKRLREWSHSEQVVSRIQANRFGLIVRDEVQIRPNTDVQNVMEIFEKPIQLNGQRLYIELRAAIARAPEHGTSAETLLRSAEHALERAKHNRTACMEAEIESEPSGQRSLTLLGELRTALAEQQFHLVFQPKWDTRTQQITSVEALIRWHHPERGNVPPDHFIPFCEQTGFIRQITPWVIREAIATTARLIKAGIDIDVCINLSALDLDNSKLESLLANTLAQHQVPADRICLEVTESAFMLDPEVAQISLEHLRALGLKLAIDDYGSGQASLSYVRDLPVQELKIDRSFISEVDKNPRNAAIVRSTLILCQELDIVQVAEGVETKAELDWLMKQNCSHIQGYLISKPLSEADLISRMLAKQPFGAQDLD